MPGIITNVRTTSGQDKYIVQTTGPDGVRQEILSKDEIEARGGRVPEQQEQANIAHQIGVTQGREASKEYVETKAAEKLGLTREELTKPITGNINEQLKEAARRLGMSEQAFVETYQKWQSNPNAAEFANISPYISRWFEKAEPYAQPQVAVSVAYDRINKAAKENPKVIKTQVIDGKQVNVINIEEAVKSGLSLATLKAAGRADVPTLVKKTSSDPGTIYQGGFRVSGKEYAEAKKALKNTKANIETPSKAEKYYIRGTIAGDIVTFVESGSNQGKLVNVSKEVYDQYQNWDAQQKSSVAARKYLEDKGLASITGGIYQTDLVAALEKNVPENLLINAGYTKATINQAKSSLESYRLEVAGLEQLKKDLAPFTDENGNVYLEMAIASGISTDRLKSAFKEDDIKKASDAVKASRDTGVALAGEKDYYYNGRVISPKERQRIIDNYETKRDALLRDGKAFGSEWQALGEHPANAMTVSPAVGRRMMISAAEWVFPAAKALKPEYKISDVSGMEWGIGAANVALFAAPYIAAPLKGVGAAINVTKAGTPILGSTTAYKMGVAAIQAGAGAVYTADTVEGIINKRLKGANLVFAILIDTAILAVAISSGVGALKSIKAPKQGAFKFDFSAKAKTMTGSDKVAAAFDDIQAAIARKDPLQLKAAAKRLELAAGELPKQLDGGYLAKRARLMAANADDYIRLAKDKPANPEIYKSGIDANKQHLDLLEKQLKNTKNPATRQAIEKAIKDTRKVIVETKEKPVAITEDIRTFDSKNLPEVKRSTALTKAAREKVSKSTESIKVGKKAIPVKEFATKSARQVVEKYKVSPAVLVWAVSRLPINVKEILAISNPEIIAYPATVELETPVTVVSPYDEPAIKDAPSIRSQPLTETATALDLKTQTVTKTESIIETKPEPGPTPKPEPAQEPVKFTTLAPTKTDTPTKTTPPNKNTPRMLGGRKEGSDWTREEAESAIAWKDGFNIIAIKYPYRRGIDEASFNENNIPPGLTVLKNYKGAGSQQASVKVKGKFPKKRTVDVGNQDVIITRKGNNRVTLQHRYGPNTRSQNTIKRGQNISTRRGKVYHTRAGGGTILSRKPFRGY